MKIFKITSFENTTPEYKNTTYATANALQNNKALSLKQWKLYGCTDGECNNRLFCEGSITEIVDFVANNQGDWYLKSVNPNPNHLFSKLLPGKEIHRIICSIDVEE
jgi:hypothetical protein